jgi:very-short-patch-repair endonuclease
MSRILAQQIKLARLPDFQTEYVFHDTRRWRFDFAWPVHLLAAEYEGGIWTGGSHTRGRRYQTDCEKYSEAAIMGWRVLRFTHDHVRSGAALDMLMRAFEALDA